MINNSRKLLFTIFFLCSLIFVIGLDHQNVVFARQTTSVEYDTLELLREYSALIDDFQKPNASTTFLHDAKRMIVDIQFLLNEYPNADQELRKHLRETVEMLQDVVDFVNKWGDKDGDFILTTGGSIGTALFSANPIALLGSVFRVSYLSDELESDFDGLVRKIEFLGNEHTKLVNHLQIYDNPEIIRLARKLRTLDSVAKNEATNTEDNMSSLFCFGLWILWFVAKVATGLERRAKFG